MIRQTLASVALTLGLAATPAFATDLTQMSDAERQTFRDEIRAYLLENPEVLMEAIAVLESRDANAQAANDRALVSQHADALFFDGYSWEGGNPDGDVTLVEFTDYRCGYCRKAHDEVASLIESDGNIRFIVKEFPILGEESELSSRFAIAVKINEGDAAYKQAHDALIKFRGKVSVESLSKMSNKMGFDTDAVMASMLSAQVENVIQSNRALAAQMQISGTPTFVLRDQLLRGYVPLAGMQQIVAQTRAN